MVVLTTCVVAVLVPNHIKHSGHPQHDSEIIASETGVNTPFSCPTLVDYKPLKIGFLYISLSLNEIKPNK
jgi:hypothetical protein